MINSASSQQTLSERMDTAKESPLFYKVFMLVGAGLLLDGSDVYMASNINSTMVATKFATLAQGSMFISAGFLGLFIGSIITGYVGDFLGRRKTFQWNLLLFGLATLVGAFAPNIQTLIAIRFIAAIGMGAEVITGFAMVSEFSPVKNRGKWSGCVSVFTNLGAPFGFFLSTIFITHFGWRSMFIIVGAFALILWFMRRHLPESPRWLMVHNEENEAKKVINKLEINGHYDTDEIKENASSSTSHTRGLIVATFAVSGTFLCQYMFTSWVPTLLLGKGINIIHSMWFSTLMMMGAPIGGIIGMFLVDKIGRKKTIVPAFIFTAIAGISYAFQNTNTAILINGLILTALLYILMAGCVAVYAPELFDTSFRFRGNGYANGIAKLLTTLSPYFVLWVMQHSNQYVLFTSIAAIAIISAIVIGFFGPETKKTSIQ